MKKFSLLRLADLKNIFLFFVSAKRTIENFLHYAKRNNENFLFFYVRQA